MRDQEIAYVIVDYQTPDEAKRALVSIKDRRPGSEVIIVDASAGLGYSQALNQGIGQLASRADIVVALNADVEMIQRDDLVIERFEADRDLAIVGPRQLDGGDRIAHGGIVAFEDGTDWDLDLRHRCWLWQWEHENEADLLTGGAFLVPTVAGSIMYVRRYALGQLGGFPEWTSFYYEDTYLCYLARHLGWRVLYDGTVTWRHYGQGAPVAADWRTKAMEKARDLFVYHCGRVGIPLRIWPDDDPNTMAQEVGAL